MSLCKKPFIKNICVWKSNEKFESILINVLLTSLQGGAERDLRNKTAGRGAKTRLLAGARGEVLLRWAKFNKYYFSPLPR
jgi:hypothetical protein